MREMNTKTQLDDAALRYHSEGRPGKIGIVPTKPYHTQYDLSLAYSPGVRLRRWPSPKSRTTFTNTRARATSWP